MKFRFWSKFIINTNALSLLKIMVIMGFFLMLVQVNRVGGSVMAAALAKSHGLTPGAIGFYKRLGFKVIDNAVQKGFFLRTIC